jgi:flagellin
MMKTAEGAVSSTVEILKSLKEKAINAANDTNTDSDRTTIQKEIDQFIDQIDDNALTTFNGKYLVDGSKNNAHMNTRSAFTNQSLSTDTSGTTKLAEDNSAGDPGLKNRLGESLEINSTDYVTASFVKDGKTYTTTYQVGDSTVEDIFSNLNAEYTDKTSDTVAAFAGASAAGGTAPVDTTTSTIAAAGDDVLADLVANGTSGAVVGAYADSENLVTALTEYGSGTTPSATTAKNDAIKALKDKIDGVSVQFNNNAGAALEFDGADGSTHYTADTTTGITKGTTQSLATVTTDQDNSTSIGSQIATEVAAWGAKANSADVSQSVIGSLNLSPTQATNSASELQAVVNAAGKEFHEAARAGLVEAAALAVQPVKVDTKSLADGGEITADNADAYIAKDSAHGDSDLQTLAQDINALVAGTIDSTLATGGTGDKLLAAVQSALGKQAVKDAYLASDATGANLDKANHKVDAAVAEKVKADAAAGATTTTTTTSGPAHDSDTTAPSELVHKGTDIGTNKSDDTVYTADGTEGLTVTAGTAGVKGQISGVTISISDSNGNVKKAANAALDKFSMSIRAENRTTDADKNNNLTFQVGAEANQAIAVSLTDMRSEALGLKGSDGTKVSVATQDKANAAVAVFDNAISKALDQQTTIGSIEARLEYTSSNLTTSSENVQAAESTIRDADMAKEMTNYTKNNVLLQAAQSMLAQANQSSSAVLSLLQ